MSDTDQANNQKGPNDALAIAGSSGTAPDALAIAGSSGTAPEKRAATDTPEGEPDNKKQKGEGSQFQEIDSEETIELTEEECHCGFSTTDFERIKIATEAFGETSIHIQNLLLADIMGPFVEQEEKESDVKEEEKESDVKEEEKESDDKEEEKESDDKEEEKESDDKEEKIIVTKAKEMISFSYHDKVVGEGAQVHAGAKVTIFFTVTLRASNEMIENNKGGRALTFHTGSDQRCNVWDDFINDMKRGGHRKVYLDNEEGKKFLQKLYGKLWNRRLQLLNEDSIRIDIYLNNVF